MSVGNETFFPICVQIKVTMSRAFLPRGFSSSYLSWFPDRCPGTISIFVKYLPSYTNLIGTPQWPKHEWVSRLLRDWDIWESTPQWLKHLGVDYPATETSGSRLHRNWNICESTPQWLKHPWVDSPGTETSGSRLPRNWNIRESTPPGLKNQGVDYPVTETSGSRLPTDWNIWESTPLWIRHKQQQKIIREVIRLSKWMIIARVSVNKSNIRVL